MKRRQFLSPARQSRVMPIVSSNGELFMSQVKTVRTEIAKGQQSQTYIEILQIGDAMCEIEIESDSYDFQSHARGKVWSKRDMRWNTCVNIPYGLMGTPEKLYYRALVTSQDFKADRDSILKRLLEVLGTGSPTRSETRRETKADR